MSVGKVWMKGNKIFVEKRLLCKENIMTACEEVFFFNEKEEIDIR